ncbi:MAG: type VI secretion system accessory protein TagJ [Candidatus Thiodiazotropha sp.]|jgi:type VI secretion system protein ImpE
MQADELLQQGDLDNSVQALQQSVREQPADPGLRVFLFQLLCVTGDWQRALSQLQLTGELDALNLPMVQTYREAIACELFRQQVFDGRQSPLVFGDPPAWIALLIEALHLHGEGEPERGKQLQQAAFEQAPVNPGTLDGEPFAWLADADQRIGPVLEAIINGRYYWIPMQHLSRVELEPPSDLRDMVWAPAQLQFVNSGTTVALVPSRYCGTEGSDDAGLKLARKTLWQEPVADFYTGLGQRMLVTDKGEHALLNVRNISFEAP